MQHGKHQHNSKFHAHCCSCGGHPKTSTSSISRRGFLGGLANLAALGGLTLATTSQAPAVSTKPISSGIILPRGTALRIKPGTPNPSKGKRGGQENRVRIEEAGISSRVSHRGHACGAGE